MKVLLDTNILTRSAEPTHPMHAMARDAVRKLRADDAGAIEGQGGQPDRLAACCKDDVFRKQTGRRLLAALTALDGDRVSFIALAGEASGRVSRW